MTIKTGPTYWKTVWHHLTEPAAGIKVEEQRQQARLLSVLLLTFFVIVGITTPLWVWSLPDFITAPHIASGLLIATALAYGLSRTRFYYTGAGLLILAIFILVITVLLSAPGPVTARMLVLKSLVVAVMIGIIFLRWQFALLLTGICLGTIGLFFFIPGIPFVNTYSDLAFFLAITSLMVIQAALGQHYKRKLVASEERYRALFEQAHDAVFILNPELRCLEANQRAVDLLGYTLAEIQQLGVEDLSVDVVESAKVYKRLLADEYVPVYERLFRKKDDSLIQVEVKVELVRDAEGNPLHIQSVVRDITERKEREQQLRQSEARQRALLNAIPDLMFRNHRDGTFLDYHAGNEVQLAVSPEQFLGRKTTDVLPPELAERHMHHIEQVLQTGQQAIYEYTMLLHEETRHYEARMVPSGPDEVLAIMRDVTEQKKWQAQAMELALERERAGLLRQFVRNASHELRTPLSIINNGLYLITKVSDEEKQRYYAEQGQQQIMRLAYLLDMILTMTKLDSEIPFVFQETDINEIVGQLVGDAEKSFSEKGGHIQFDAGPALPPCRVDVDWLSEAIHHLLDNAIRFTPGSGWIKVGTWQQNGYVVIEVSDSGIGISEEVLPRIFERFWRYDKVHSTPGFGLGLSIAQKIVGRHNGRIEVESEVGQGSQFRILLPYDANPDS